MATIKKVLCSRCKRKRSANLFVARSKRCLSCRRIYWQKYMKTPTGKLRHQLAQKAYVKRLAKAEKRA